MAVIRAPYGTSQVAGSIGSTTFQRSRSGLLIRQRTAPVNPNTSRQNTVRARMGTFTARWINTLTQAQRDAWEVYSQGTPVPNKFGDPMILSGLNMYVRANLAGADVSGTPIDDAPNTPGLGSPIDMTLAGDTTNGIQVTAFDPAIPAGTVVTIREGAAVNFSRNNYTSPFTFIQGATSATVLPLTLRAAANVVIGQRWFYLIRTIEQTGKVSETIQRFVDITA